MAIRFATATGNWSNTAIWDGGTLPLSDDTVHPNGFTVTIDQDITIASLNNNISPVYLPGMPIPKMTGNIVPSGIVNAGSDTSNAWKGFDQDAPTPSTFWAGTGVAAVNSTAWLSYQFTAAKTIKRYYIYRAAQNPKPTSWVFQGSNDGSTWADLETVTANALNTPYLSGVLANTTAYLYYRINVTAVTSGTIANIYQFEMTESTATTYGITTGGSFTVPASLSGTRNIVFSGAGIVSNNSLTSGIVQTNHIAGNTVNFNVQSGGYIINPQWVTVNTINVKGVAINGNGTVNFNSNIWGHTGTNYNDTAAGSIYINSNANVTINGNVYAPTGNVSSGSFTINSAVTTSTSAILNINGDIIGSSAIINSNNIYLNSALTVNIVGNLTSNKGYCLNIGYANIINIIGNITLTDNTSTTAINSNGNAVITINGSITNKGNRMAINTQYLKFASTATPYWIFQTNAGTDMTLAYGSATGAYPTEADVRFGTTYAASPTRTGTLRVPLPQYVSQGVLTDNTVGTAYINAADVWNVLTSSITTAGSIGERLKTASTVQTNGDQLAAYIV